jgi:tetratricopeptide (TPR) repeat protein
MASSVQQRTKLQRSGLLSWKFVLDSVIPTGAKRTARILGLPCMATGHQLSQYAAAYLRDTILACCFSTIALLPAAGKVVPQAANLSPSASGPVLADENFQQGLLALKENRFAAALDSLTAAEREHPADARVRNFRGIALGALGQHAEAAAEYREAIRLDPTFADAYRNLGFLEWTQQQLEAARNTLERAVQLAPDDSFAHYYLGRVHLDAQRYAQAFDELGRSQVPWPEDPALLIQVAAGYAAIERIDDARRTLERLTDRPLSDAQASQVAALLLRVNREDAAISLLQKFATDPPSPSKAWARFDLATAHLLARDYDKAESEARAYISSLQEPASNPSQAASGWSLVGVANARLGRAEQAVDAFREAANLAPSQEESWLNLTRELMEVSRYTEAISAVQQGLASNPKSYALHLRLGAVYLASGKYAEAETVFRDLVTAGDPLPTGYVGLAQVLLRTGRADEAASELAAAQQKLGPTFLVSYFRGLALERAAKPSEALSSFQDAVRLNPDSAEAYLGVGQAELALGRARDAIAELEHALRLDPKNVQARRLLSTAYRKAGDLRNAAKYAQGASSASPAMPKNDLVGDFFLPEWQTPAEGTSH